MERSLDFWIFGILDFSAIPKIQKSKIPKIQTSLHHLLENIGFGDLGFCRNCAWLSHKLDKDERLYARTMLMTAFKDAPDAIKLDARRLVELQVESNDRGR